MKPRVAISIVIPAYNEEKLIGRCLTSLKNQQFTRPYEIIVVNNNSTDATEKIARSFGVKVIHEPQQGVVFARQRGLLFAHGAIIAGADCDSEYPPDWLEKIYNHFASNTRVVAAGGPGLAEKHPAWAYWICELGYSLVNHYYQLTGHVLYLSAFNFAFKRKFFLTLGGYHTYLELGGGDELDPLARLQKSGRVVFNSTLCVKMNTRRYRVGFLRWLFVHCFYYYILSYWLAKLFHRTLIRNQPVRNI